MRHDTTMPTRRSRKALIARWGVPVALAALGTTAGTAGLAHAAGPAPLPPKRVEVRLYSPVTQNMILAEKYSENNDAKVTFVGVGTGAGKGEDPYINKWYINDGLSGMFTTGTVVTLRSVNLVNGNQYCLDSHDNRNPLYAHVCNGGDYQKWSVQSGTCAGAGNYSVLVNIATGKKIEDFKGHPVARDCNRGAINPIPLN